MKRVGDIADSLNELTYEFDRELEKWLTNNDPMMMPAIMDDEMGDEIAWVNYFSDYIYERCSDK